jgi:hypothetical protein
MDDIGDDMKKTYTICHYCQNDKDDPSFQNMICYREHINRKVVKEFWSQDNGATFDETSKTGNCGCPQWRRITYKNLLLELI